MKLLDRFCRWYMTKKQKVVKEAEKKAKDVKLEEAGNKLKLLYEFVRFINEKVLTTRHERKSFWMSVSKGEPLVENTVIKVLRQMGVKEESIQEVIKAKHARMEQKPVEPIKKTDEVKN